MNQVLQALQENLLKSSPSRGSATPDPVIVHPVVRDDQERVEVTASSDVTIDTFWGGETENRTSLVTSTPQPSPDGGEGNGFLGEGESELRKHH
jgi:hypothetical protein